MLKILITHSYFYRFDPKQWDTKKPYPPLGTLYAASVLRESGFDVSVFDTNLAESVYDILDTIKKQKPDILVIYDDGFNYLTKMCLTKMREAAFQLSKIGKEHGCRVIVSSSDSSDHYDKYLKEGADFIIAGEGEETLKELIIELDKNESDIQVVNGIVYFENDKIIKTPGRGVLNNLDQLPFPAWDLIDIEKYKNIWMENHGYFSLNIATTRGCPFRCNWCAKPIYGNRYNSRSPENVVKEIEYLLEKFQPGHFWVCDFWIKTRLGQ